MARHHRTSTRQRLLTVVLATMGLLASTTPAQAATSADFLSARFFGSAWGGTADMTLPEVSVGEIARQYLGCGFRDKSTNSVNKVNVNPGQPLLQTGTVDNTGIVSRAPDGASLHESSIIQEVSLLDGLITATAVEVRAHTRFDATGINHHTTIDGHPGGLDGSTGVTFVDLVINGVAIESSPAPNTVIPIPNGEVVLNEQSTFGGKLAGHHRGIHVVGIHVTIDALVTEGDIQLGVVHNKLSPKRGVIAAAADTFTMRAPPVAYVGRQALKTMDCTGTDGLDETLTQVGIVVPNPAGGPALLNATGANTVNGDVTETGAEAHARAELEDVDLLDGLVTADAVTTWTDTVSTDEGVESTWRVEFVNLVVNGELIVEVGEVPPRTTIEVPGVGEIILTGKNCDSDHATNPKRCDGVSFSRIKAFAIKVKVNDAPGLGLPDGAVMEVGNARSRVTWAS